MTQAQTPRVSGRPAAAARSDEMRRWLDLQVGERIDAGEAFFTANALAVAACASAMADRFFDGGELLVFGGGAYATDAQHNSVEYVHPVLPGCRALPALSLTNDVATITADLQGGDPDEVYARQIAVLGRDRDIALAFSALPLHASVARGLAVAGAAGMLTIALTTAPPGVATGTAGADLGPFADHLFTVVTEDRLVAQELHLATYHMLWELVHIVLNHRGIGAGAS